MASLSNTDNGEVGRLDLVGPVTSSDQPAALRDLAGRVAIVTGGASGIGLAAAATLNRRGALVELLDRDTDAVESAAAELGDGVGSHVVDVTDRTAVDAAIRAVVAAHEHIDIVVSNAGYGRLQPFLDIEPHTWQRHLDVNLVGTYNVVQLAARSMVAAGRGGSIVLTGSTASSFPCDHLSAYAVVKAGVAMLGRSLASELGPYGIRVNTVLPGVIASAMTTPLLDDSVGERLLTGETPLGRIGAPDDVADVIAFLASADSRFVTGEAILVDGGQTIHGYPRWRSIDAAQGAEATWRSHGERMKEFQ